MKKSTIVLASLLTVVLLVCAIVAFKANQKFAFPELCPRSDWNLYGCIWFTGVGKTQQLEISQPDAVYSILEQVTVKRTEKNNIMQIPCISFWIQTEDDHSIEIVLGENGELTIADVEDLTGTRTYWRTTDLSAYGQILELLQLEK